MSSTSINIGNAPRSLQVTILEVELVILTRRDYWSWCVRTYSFLYGVTQMFKFTVILVLTTILCNYQCHCFYERKKTDTCLLKARVIHSFYKPRITVVFWLLFGPTPVTRLPSFQVLKWYVNFMETRQNICFGQHKFCSVQFT